MVTAAADRRLEAAAQRDALHWYLAQVESGAEIAVTERLAARGVFAWTPLGVRQAWRSPAARRRGERKVAVWHAAAPGYVVIGLDPAWERWVAVLGCPGVLRVLRCAPVDGEAGPPARLRVDQVDALLAIGEVEPPPRRWLAVGDAVEVVGGRFDGRRGRVTSLARRGRAPRGEVELALDGILGRAVVSRCAVRGL